MVKIFRIKTLTCPNCDHKFRYSEKQGETKPWLKCPRCGTPVGVPIKS